MLADFLVIGLLLGWLQGGRLYHLSQVRFSFLWVVLLGMLAKFVFLTIDVPFVTFFHLLSMGVVLLGILFNIRLVGMPLLGLGLLANLLVIGINQGKMPVHPGVARWLNLENLIHKLEQGLYPEYMLMNSSSHLPFLADILPYFSPLWRRFFVVSIGDYLLGMGVAWFLCHYMKRKEKKTCPVEFPKQSFR